MKQRSKKSVLDSHAFNNLEKTTMTNMTEKQFEKYTEMYKERTEALNYIGDNLVSLSDITNTIDGLSNNVAHLVETVHRIGNIMDK